MIFTATFIVSFFFALGMSATIFGALNNLGYLKDKLTIKILGTTSATAGSNLVITHYTPIFSYIEGCFSGTYGYSGYFVAYSFVLLIATWAYNIYHKGVPMQ